MGYRAFFLFSKSVSILSSQVSLHKQQNNDSRKQRSQLPSQHPPVSADNQKKSWRKVGPGGTQAQKEEQVPETQTPTTAFSSPPLRVELHRQKRTKLHLGSAKARKKKNRALGRRQLSTADAQVQGTSQQTQDKSRPRAE